MSALLKSLKEELEVISSRILELRLLVEEAEDADREKKLRNELRRLQWQALFYLEKIYNLEQNRSE